MTISDSAQIQSSGIRPQKEHHALTKNPETDNWLLRRLTQLPVNETALLQADALDAGISLELLHRDIIWHLELGHIPFARLNFYRSWFLIRTGEDLFEVARCEQLNSPSPYRSNKFERLKR